VTDYTPEHAQAEIDRLREKGLADPHGSPEAREKLRQELATEAHEVVQDFRTGVRDIRSKLVHQAALAHRIRQERSWEALGYDGGEDGLGELLSEPDIEMSRSDFYRLAQLHEEFVVRRNVAPARLAGLLPSKVMAVLPAVTAGKVSMDEALSDAETLRRHDLRAKYSGDRDPHAQLDATAEPPQQIRCDTCGQWYTPNGGGPQA
jgi:hypothetical protein